jgi:dephospho-CoA kinase
MNTEKPLLVGITGGIGSGKSLVCRVFASMGIPVYNADDRAKWLSQHDSIIRESVIDLLGEEAYDREGNYNRGYVASRVFADENLLQRLNGIIHPRVKEDTAIWISKNQGRPYLLKEAAIMKKTGRSDDPDYVIVVTAPHDLRVSRVLARDPHRSRQEIEAIMLNQVTDEIRLEQADFHINNDGLAPLLPQVWALDEKLKSLSTDL